MEFIYDDSKLQQMWRELEPKRRVQALKGALRAEANRVCRIGRGIIAGQFRHGRQLAGGMRAVVYKKKAVGFKVTVAGKKTKKKFEDKKKHAADARKRSMHVNSRGLEKPVLLWATLGTKMRQTKGRFGWKGYRAGANRGRMNEMRFDFMRRTASMADGTVCANLSRAIVESVTKIAKKYGAK